MSGSFLKTTFPNASESVTPATEPTLDDLFMQQILQPMHEKIGDTDLGIEHLCRAVHIGNTQLFRKMKALTGESPVRFIQKIRLQKPKRCSWQPNSTSPKLPTR